MALCWETKSTPSSWHLSYVTAVYKKGDPSLCENYRPISLVSVLYKVYAKVLLNRLKAGGAEDRLSRRQFGFRSHRSTQDALFIVRRRVEQAWASRGGRAYVLALDWRRAFDSIAPERLLMALRRFGLNQEMLDAIADIYDNRFFQVREDGGLSSERKQRAGISQGCPLSPFLFGMVMTILMEDARALLSVEARQALSAGSLEEVLYADDTLVIGACGRHVEEYMATIESCGHHYGLEIHWGKGQGLTACTDAAVHDPSGNCIQPSDSMLYLGAMVHSNGRAHTEVGRRIGAAAKDFKQLSAVWKHSSLKLTRKVELLDSMVLSKLGYALASLWLTKSDLRRLDGFHANCLRKILRIPSAFLSRVSNDKVRARAAQQPFSVRVASLQMRLFNEVLTCPHKAELKRVAFHGESLVPETAAWVRRVGRPRQNWTDQMLARAKAEGTCI